MKNPLAVTQRETAGSTTLTKYFYQYHWALDKLLQKHSNREDYIIFIEVHEDVVFSNSLLNNGDFDFYQIKDTKRKNLESILKPPKNKSFKDSIVGKCISSVSNKAYEERVKTINLVVSQGFNLKDHLSSDLKLEEIKTSDFKKESLKMLVDAIELEFDIKFDIDKLRFLSSDLYSDHTAMEQKVIGHIAQVSSAIFSGQPNNANNSYIVLIDTLQRKGMCKYDFKNWDDFVKNKGLTCEQVDSVLKNNTADGFKEMKEAFEDICLDLGIKNYKKASFKKRLEAFHSDIVFKKARHSLHAIDKIENYLVENDFELEEISSSTISSIIDSLKVPNVDMELASIYCIVQRVINYE